MYDNQHLKENVFSVTIDSLVILTTVQEAQAPSLPVYFSIRNTQQTFHLMQSIVHPFK